jgi:4-alpha-glucanotransferase
MLDRRRSGLLVHITSLPSRFGIGDLGPASHEFIDFLARAGQTVWQVLPLNATDPASGNAPYSSPSAFAGNPLLISPEKLVQDGLLEEKDLEPVPDLPRGRVSYEEVIAYKSRILEKAYERFSHFRTTQSTVDYDVFCEENAFWLDDYVVYRALKNHFGGKPWTEWPAELRDRESEPLADATDELDGEIRRARFRQYLFFNQLRALRKRCNENRVFLLGDLPIYVSHDSADVWGHRDIFKLTQDGNLAAQAGVPPDYFSATGQLWGNPVYRWDVLQRRGYGWWIKRMAHSLRLYDLVRIDHFRAFAGYWEIPAGHKTAVKGEWKDGPADDFFHVLRKHFPKLPVIAEDLGTITPDVRELMARFRIPGSKVLVFAFGDDVATNDYAPHNLVPNAVIYTGTHDNNTIRGWLEQEASDEQKKRVFGYIGRRHSIEDVSWEFVRMAVQSVCRVCIIPAQDLLGLDGRSRMNQPATSSGNWTWRLVPGQLSDQLAGDLRELTWLAGRLG